LWNAAVSKKKGRLLQKTRFQGRTVRMIVERNAVVPAKRTGGFALADVPQGKTPKVLKNRRETNRELREKRTHTNVRRGVVHGVGSTTGMGINRHQEQEVFGGAREQVESGPALTKAWIRTIHRVKGNAAAHTGEGAEKKIRETRPPGEKEIKKPVQSPRYGCTAN